MGIERLLRELEGCRNIVVDSNVLIYFLQNDEVYGQMAKGLFHLVEKGFLNVYVSVVTVSEVLVKPIHDNNRKFIDDFSMFLHLFPNLAVLDITEEIAYHAAAVRAKKGLHLADAFIIGTAMKNRSALVGNDTQWLSKKLPVPYYCFKEYVL